MTCRTIFSIYTFSWYVSSHVCFPFPSNRHTRLIAVIYRSMMLYWSHLIGVKGFTLLYSFKFLRRKDEYIYIFRVNYFFKTLRQF